MKLLLVATLLTAQLGHARSIDPAKIVTPFLDIFSSRNIKLSEDKMEVRVSTYNRDGDIFKGRDKLEIPMAKYQEILRHSQAVMQMIPSQAKIERNDGKFSKGTAFHIGENLVLTNHHVLSPDHANFTECDGFELVQNQSDVVFSCKKVHYCNADHDVCLIEMEPYKKCLNFLCGKFKMIELKDSPSLKLNGNVIQRQFGDHEKVLTAIGNTMGLGIHYSQGKGFSSNPERIFFCAPVRAGNSGGALLDGDLVVGIVQGEYPIKVGTGAYNGATPISLAISLINEHVTDEEVLKKFNSAIAK